MQHEATSSSPSWLYLGYLLIAAFLGYGARWLTAIWNRKRPKAEIEKVQAETRRITVQTDVELLQSVTKAAMRMARQQEENDELEFKNEQLQTELKLNEKQIRKLKGLLDVHGISFSEFDERD